MKFKVYGEYVTEQARTMFWDDRCTYASVEEYLLGIIDIDSLTAKEIIEGRKKLTGINTFSVEDDNEEIRIISPITIARHEHDLKEAVKRDMEWNVRKYIDYYALDKSWKYFVGYTPKQAYEYAYTDAADIARHVKGKGPYFIEGIPHLNEPLNLSNTYDDSIKDPLDHGAYLVNDYELVYKLMGRPVYDGNRREFYDKLYQYWEKSPLKDTPEVQRRQENYLKAVKTVSVPSTSKKTEEIKEEITKPSNTFGCEYGIISPKGEWYDVDWGWHSYKAKDILLRDGYPVQEKSLDECLDLLVSRGYILIRDPLNTCPFIYGQQPNVEQEETIKRYENRFKTVLRREIMSETDISWFYRL